MAECTIPLCVPEIRGREGEYIKDCLDTRWVSSGGSYVERFERMIADYVACRFAVACVNGTAALHVALMIIGIGPGDEVILPDISFIAPANAVRYTGAHPVFMDVDETTWQIDPEKLRDFLNKECEYKNRTVVNRHTKRNIRVLLLVHVLGHPVDMDPVNDLAEEFGLKVVEDATESLGSKYKGRITGSLSHMACFSFNGNKIITTGGGGMLVTNYEAWARRAKYLTTQAKDDPVESIHHEVGYNYRLTNLQAAMGVAQMELLDEFIDKKRRIAKFYQDAFKKTETVIPFKDAPWAESNAWLSAVTVDGNKAGLSSRELLRFLEDKGIETRPLWHPLHALKPFKDCYSYCIENAPKIYERALCLPSSVGLSRQDQNKVISLIKTIVKK